MNALLPHSPVHKSESFGGMGILCQQANPLAHTLKRGEHIRVTLLLGALRGGARRALEIWALAAASLLAALFAGYSCKLAWQSHAFHDISTSNDATPLWLPQLAMAIGTVVLAIAFVDELVLEIRGRRVVPVSDEAMRNE